MTRKGLAFLNEGSQYRLSEISRKIFNRRMNMKKIFSVLMLCAVFAFASFVPAKANTIDITTLTCESIETMPEEVAQAFIFWMAGGIAASMDSSVFDPAFVGEYAGALQAGCEKDKKSKITDLTVEFLKTKAK